MGKRVVLGALAGTVVIFVLAGLFFGFLFAGFFADHFPAEFAAVNRPAMDFRLIIVSDFLYALMLSFLLASLAGPRTFARGALVGGMLGLAVALHLDLITAATTYLTTPPGIAVNVLLSGIMSGAGGGVIAATQRRLEGDAGTGRAA
jgi:hypothetical protein